MQYLFLVLLAIFIFVCLFMILLVLIQKGRGGGIASAFGGAGGNTAFGSKTGDVLTWATAVVFGVFLLLAVVLNLIANKMHDNLVAGRSAQVLPAPTGPANGPEQGPAAPGVPVEKTPTPSPTTTPIK